MEQRNKMFFYVMVCYLTGWFCVESNLDTGGFSVHITDQGDYNVQVGTDVWLTSSSTYFTVAGQTYSAADGSLKLSNRTTSSGKDKQGTWTSDDFHYYPAGVHLVARLKKYTGKNFVIFEQSFPEGVEGTDVGNPNFASSGFPRFAIGGQKVELGYLQFGGMMVGDTTKWMDRWNNETLNIRDGIPGGPLVLFDHSDHVLLISSYTEFMSSVTQHDKFFGGNLAWGVMGSAKSIPADYSLQTIIYYCDHGVNQAFDEWGEMMRYEYGRHDDFVKADLVNNYLGYWMDNGSYYYYNTEKGLNYEQTIYAVQDYAKSAGIPYRYVQYDSWWYYEGPLKGITRWEGRPDIFPNGMQKVYNRTGWPVVAHNRWWSSKTTYAKKNGGKFDFIVEALKAAPLKSDFWEYLFTTSKTWGLTTYEQDWMNVELIGINAFKEDPMLARQWLLTMGKAAAKTGVTLQYCMSYSRHALQALEIPVVTQARVTNDYAPGRSNWKMGMTSMFAYSLGLAVYKDTFWTSQNQTGNPYGLEEYYPALNAVVSTLSTGPVGPGDGIGKTNVSLLMRCCNQDGLILKPDKAATAIDAQIYQGAFNDGIGPGGEVWSTYSEVSGMRFGIILAAEVPTGTNFKLTPYSAGFREKFAPSRIFADNPLTPEPASPFSEKSPLLITGACTASNFCLHHTTPVLNFKGKELLLYGEIAKFVPMCSKRFRGISLSSTDVIVTLSGAENENVEFWYSLGGSKQNITCVLPASGAARISIMKNNCAPL